MIASASPRAPALSVYVYFRVPSTLQAAAHAALAAMQGSLSAAYPGLQPRLMRRADSQHNEPEATWMEVYEHPAGLDADFVDALAIAAAKLPPGLTGPRHIELFCPLVPEAPGAFNLIEVV